MQQVPTREHWVNTLVGIINASYSLTPVEVVELKDAVAALLDYLRVPARGVPACLSTELAQEVHEGFYSSKFDETGLQAASQRGPAQGLDHEASDVWRQTLLRQITSAYPDLAAIDKMAAASVFSKLVDSIRGPQRSVHHTPGALTLTKDAL